MSGRTIYAIGDVHGMAQKLAALYEAIADHLLATGAAATIVHLGDYVDRGPDSARVIDMVVNAQARFAGAARLVALRGNHEQMLLDAVDGVADGEDEEQWLLSGGAATIASYGGGRDWRQAIEPAHIAWLRALPLIHREGDTLCVHAGIEPATFPACEEDVLLWTRSRRFFDTQSWPQRPELAGLRVVHGHTPTDDAQPYADARRINVDTGAVFGGPLTCAVIAPGERARFLFA